MNIHQKLWNKLHRPLHHKIGVTCLFSDRYIPCCNNTTI